MFLSIFHIFPKDPNHMSLRFRDFPYNPMTWVTINPIRSGAIWILRDYMGVALNGGTPISHPKCWSFLVGKPHGSCWVPPHHFGSCPHIFPIQATLRLKDGSIHEMFPPNSRRSKSKSTKLMLETSAFKTIFWDGAVLFFLLFVSCFLFLFAQKKQLLRKQRF